MAQDKASGSVADKLLDRESTELRGTFAQKHTRLIATTNLLQETVVALREKGWATHATLWNACLYLNLAAHDLSILLEDLAFERDNWRRRFIARNLALLAYESTKDMQTLLGKTFRDALDNLGVLSRFDSRIRDARKPLDSFWNEHQSNLKQVRVASAAHRTHDGVALLDTIEKIDIDDSLIIGLALGRILNELGPTLQEIITETSKIVPPER